jgi:hypothetical protein
MSVTTTSDRLEVIPDQGVEPDPAPSALTISGSDLAGLPEPQASTRPTFTITDAATACSVSRKTITRKLPELAGHGAAKDDDGVWRIPVEALLAVGLHPGRSLPAIVDAVARPVASAPVPPRAPDQETVTIPRDRWDDLRIRLARAEAEAAERGFALADARLALRALTAGPNVLPSDPARSATTAAPPSALPEGVAQVAPTGAGVAHVTGAPPAATQAPGQPDSGDAVPADVVAARNLAARTGGYVPAVTYPNKKRRWWQSR